MLSLMLASVLLDSAVVTSLSSEFRGSEWITSVVNQTALSVNIANQSQAVAHVTEIVCSLLANARSWVYMFCYFSVTGCILYDRPSMDIGNATIEPVLTEPRCRIPNINFGITCGIT